MDKIAVLNKGYKFRLYPTEVQKCSLSNPSGESALSIIDCSATESIITKKRKNL